MADIRLKSRDILNIIAFFQYTHPVSASYGATCDGQAALGAEGGGRTITVERLSEIGVKDVG